jgi:hypothetical protein
MVSAATVQQLKSAYQAWNAEKRHVPNHGSI